MRISVFFLALIALSCTQQERKAKATLFSKIEPALSGISFSNELEPNRDFNILEYLYFYNGGGVAVGDINNDSLPDLYFTANQKPNKLYLNLGGFKFKDITEEANVPGKGDWSTGVTMADINGDGLLDIYVCNVSGYKGTRGSNELFINNGNLSFIESAEEYGLDFSGFATQAVFFDYDHDSDLDVYLLNHSVHAIDSYGSADKRELKDARSGDLLLQSQIAQGSLTFKDVTKVSGIYSSKIGYGLGISAADIDNDGWQDIYVSNDFHENDYLYINNQDGTFSERLEKFMGHSSRYSMGNDIADVNNDGFLDIFTTDMLPREPAILLKSGGEDKSEVNQIKLKYGYNHQLARNTLQLNRGNGYFSDIALQAGVFATDWSWSPLLADFDNDGFKDIFITNGIVKRPNDLDYVQYISNLHDYRINVDDTVRINEEIIKRMPELKIPNEAFKTKDGVNWERCTEAWGLNEPSYSNGAAYADLDNDGDLDLIINNINLEASIYRNNSNQGNYVKISLEGKGNNKYALGSHVVLKAAGQQMFYELGTTRGFQSSVEPNLTIGIGELSVIDTLEVHWLGGAYQFLKNIKPNQWIKLKEPDSSTGITIPGSCTYFDGVANEISWKHDENSYNDYNSDYLRPYKLSTRGPAVSVGDVSGDQWQDIFLGGSKGQHSTIFYQTNSGWEGQRLSNSTDYEDVASELLDVDGDNDLDLVVLSAGHEYASGHPWLQDRLYLNQNGRLLPSNSLPDIRENSSCVASSDFDNDGDLDLFIGFDGPCDTYGLPGGGFILVNQGDGTYVDATSKLAPVVSGIGMVKAAVWSDYDQDGDDDLILAGHWMPITILINDNGVLNETLTIKNSAGLWNVIKSKDLDNDGDLDILAGNMGLNNKFKASLEYPLKLYVGDFDKNGSDESIIMHHAEGRYIPLFTKDELEKQLVSVKKKYNTYKDFAQGVSGIASLFNSLEDIEQKEVLELRSVVFYNDSAQFTVRPLPAKMQFSAINAILTMDVNADGFQDILTAGNNTNTHINLGRYDADYGSLALSARGLRFDYVDNGRSGLAVVGQVSNFRWVKLKNELQLIFVLNNDSIQSYKFTAKENYTE
ncbi:MAG: VCBS repeat-containing protein [Bacteroidota bacterium]